MPISHNCSSSVYQVTKLWAIVTKKYYLWLEKKEKEKCVITTKLT